MPKVRRAAALAAVTVLGIGCAPVAWSQPFPAKPVRMLVGFAPGGSTDTIARLIAPRLSERLGQQVIVENRPGAAGNVAGELAARAAPDGYTVFMASASHSINASLYPKLSFDAIRDFTAVTLVTSSPFVLVVHPSIPVRNTRELIALAKSRPGTLTYGSGGAASQLAGELFNSMAGVKLVHIPYKSSGPAATDLLGGQIAIMFSAPPAVLAHVAAGKLRALGITSLRRLSSAPDVPPIAESGLPGYEVNSWSGLIGPAGIPRDAVARLNADVVHVMALPEIRGRLPNLGLEATTNTPEEFGAYLRADVAKWAKVVHASGARTD
jgi:tripartite-type tricarboxylate transporter receptor subunit TctC